MLSLSQERRRSNIMSEYWKEKFGYLDNATGHAYLTYIVGSVVNAASEAEAADITATQSRLFEHRTKSRD